MKAEFPPISQIFQTAYAEFHSQFHLEKDPIYHVHRFKDPGDQEVAGFLSSILAYGNVATILGSVYKVLDVLGDRPKQAVLQGFPKHPLPYFKHRFTTGDDIWVVLQRLHLIYREYPTLEELFLAGPDTESMETLLSRFVDNFFSLSLPKELAAMEKKRKRSLNYLLPHPSRGSACKRLNLYLRWMARPDDGIDLGLWKRVGPQKLLLPVDTHLLKVLRDLKWTRSKVATWKVAEEATAELRKISPDDPVKFDFSLCHLSMNRISIRDYSKKKELVNATLE